MLTKSLNESHDVPVADELVTRINYIWVKLH